MNSAAPDFITAPWLASDAPTPVFRFVVRDGSLLHAGAAPDRPIALTDVIVTANTLKFNGRSSRVTYDLVDWPELELTGELTLHVRLRGTGPGLEQFIAGRFGQNYLTASQGWPQGNVSPRPDCQISANSRGYCQADRFYDVVLRFRPGPDQGKHEVVTELHDVAGGKLVACSHPLPRHFDNMFLSAEAQPFTIGGGGSYAVFAGEVAEVTIWHCMLPPVEVPRSADVRVAATSARIALRDDLHDPTASRRWQEWLVARETFPVAAWGYFHRFKSDGEAYRVYREANLTMVMAPLGSVAAAEAADLDPVIGLWEDDGEYAELYQHPQRLAEYVTVATKQLKRCAGYMLADEPRFKGPGVDELAPGFSYIYEHDTKALPMVNLMCYPYQMGGGFEHYLEWFIRGSRPAFLVSDVYVLYRHGLSNDSLFYANIEVVRRKALETGIGFMGFVLNTGHNRPWPENALRTASESDLHWQVNTLLAYGAQGLWYYNYRIGGESFDDALVTAEGQTTRNYEYVRQLNAGVLANGPLLQRLVSVGVWHCQSNPEQRAEFTRPYADGTIRGVAGLQADEVVVAAFEESDQSARTASPNYVMLVNQRHAEKANVADPSLQTTVVVTLAIGWRAELIDSQTGESSAVKTSGDTMQLSLCGGARALLRLVSGGA